MEEEQWEPDDRRLRPPRAGVVVLF